MKAYKTTGDGIDNLKLCELPEPVPGAHEIVVRMLAAALNFRDLLVIDGVAAWKPHAPRIPLSDGVGIVHAIGSAVSHWRIGDRVSGIFLPRWLDGALTPDKYAGPLGGPARDGVLAEYVAFDETAVVTPPRLLTDAEAATLPVAGLTAWHALQRLGISQGESILIQGTGGVSLFALQFAVARNASPLVISSSDEKLEYARSLGAVATINYKKTLQWDKKVIELTDGVGVDQVVEVVGGENLNRSLNAVRLSGSIGYVGLIAGLRAPIDVWQFVTKNVTLHGIETGSRELFEHMIRFIEEKNIRPVIGKSFHFDKVREGLTCLAGQGHFGKIVIEF